MLFSSNGRLGSVEGGQKIAPAVPEPAFALGASARQVRRRREWMGDDRGDTGSCEARAQLRLYDGALGPGMTGSSARRADLSAEAARQRRKTQGEGGWKRAGRPRPQTGQGTTRLPARRRDGSRSLRMSAANVRMRR